MAFALLMSAGTPVAMQPARVPANGACAISNMDVLCRKA